MIYKTDKKNLDWLLLRIEKILDPKIKEFEEKHFQDGLKYGCSRRESVQDLQGEEIAMALKILLKDLLIRKKKLKKSLNMKK
jgi:hypothetical protein